MHSVTPRDGKHGPILFHEVLKQVMKFIQKNTFTLVILKKKSQYTVAGTSGNTSIATPLPYLEI